LTESAALKPKAGALFALDVAPRHARIPLVSNDHQFSIRLLITNLCKLKGKPRPIVEELVFLTNPFQLR
jgi:hypothetical protein